MPCFVSGEVAQLLRIAKIGGAPEGVKATPGDRFAFLPDGSKAFVNAENDGALVVVDAVRLKMIDTISRGTPGSDAAGSSTLQGIRSFIK